MLTKENLQKALEKKEEEEEDRKLLDVRKIQRESGALRDIEVAELQGNLSGTRYLRQPLERVDVVRIRSPLERASNIGETGRAIHLVSL